MNIDYNPKMSKGNEPLGIKQKLSFKSFCKSVWVLSQTNLHYIDFCNVHEASLIELYFPVVLGIDQ